MAEQQIPYICSDSFISQMDYEAKFTWQSGRRLAFTAYQPSGAGRGIPDQPLHEVRDVGYYRATPITAFVDGDVVQVHELYTVTWEGAVVTYLNEESPVYWEGKRVYYEGEWVVDKDTSVNAVVTSKSEPIGSGEFTFASGDLSGLVDDVEDILVAQQSVTNVYDETEGVPSGQSLMSTGALTQESGDC